MIGLAIMCDVAITPEAIVCEWHQETYVTRMVVYVMASGGQPEIIINELLCFITNKMQTLPMQMIVRLCVSFYDDDVCKN